mgnify:CR=1 FL=1|jgi:hypothetical protein|tara:strand:+ start:56 stop:1369 length:1314 start_codon:yes stop_codon:yes gene_type:complete
MAKAKNGGPVDNKLKDFIEESIDVSEQLSSQLDSMVDTYSDLGAGASKLLGIDADLAILIEKQAQGVENMSKDEKKLLATKLKTVKANEDVAKSIAGQLGFLKTFKNISKAINTVLMANPLLAIAAVVVAIIGLVVKLNGILNETMREFGTSAKESGKIAIKLKVAQFQGLKMGLTAEEIKGSFVAINDTLGGVNNASAKFITQLTDASVRTGTTAEEFSKILAIQESISSSTREQLMAQTELIRANIEISGILPASVFKDVAANTQAFAEFAKDGGKNVFDAALAAKKLGLNLSNVVSIADSLLSFEDSIEKQMEASLLLGRDINLDKARELALNNDLKGAMEEVVKQVGTEAEFNELNRVQRRALADSVGVNVEELSRMVRNQGKGEAARVGSATEEVAKKQDKMLVLTTEIAFGVGKTADGVKSIDANTGEGGN